MPNLLRNVGPLIRPFSPRDYSPQLWLDAQLSPTTLSVAGVAGTGTVTLVGTALTGVGTAFTGEVKVGDTITGTDVSGTVASITSATALTLSGASGAGAGVAFTITPVAGVSARIDQANDLSGNGNHLVQATFAKKVAYLQTGIAGLPAYDVDAVDDFLRVTFGAALTQPVTVYVGCSFGSSAANRIAHSGVTALARTNLWRNITTGDIRSYAGVVLSSSAQPTGAQIYAEIYDGASSSVRQNGTSIASGDAGGFSLDGVTLGAEFQGSAPLGGKIFMYAVYSGAHTVAQQTQVENYYKARGYWS